jgi:hypothetical protein
VRGQSHAGLRVGSHAGVTCGGFTYGTHLQGDSCGTSCKGTHLRDCHVGFSCGTHVRGDSHPGLQCGGLVRDSGVGELTCGTQVWGDSYAGLTCKGRARRGRAKERVAASDEAVEEEADALSESGGEDDLTDEEGSGDETESNGGGDASYISPLAPTRALTPAASGPPAIRTSFRDARSLSFKVSPPNFYRD